MRVIYIQKDLPPLVQNITHSLSEMQRLVGGLIEVVEPFQDEVILVCDESGRNAGKPINRVINEKMDICGDFFLCGHDGYGLSDFPEELIDKYMDLFQLQELT